MQNKGAISFFAILLALVCLFELSFTWVVSGVEKDAIEFANGDKKKEKAYIDSIASEVVYNVVLKKYTYRECKEKELNLGLDLKGGMNVTLEVAVPDVLRSLSNYSNDETFNKAIALASERQKSGGDDYLDLFQKAVKELDPKAKLSSPAYFGNKDMQDVVNSTMSNDDVVAVLRTKVESSVENAFTVIRNRIDKFGVTQPNIQRLEASDRILVELPGVKDPERVRKLLQGAAKLEFWETVDNKDVFQYFEAANAKLKAINDANSGIDTSKTKLTLLPDSAGVNPDSTAAVQADTNLTLAERLAKANDSASATTDTSDAAVKAQTLKDNPLYAILSPNISQGENGGSFFNPGPVVGYAMTKDTGRVNEVLSMQEIKSLFPKDLRFLWSVKGRDERGSLFELLAIKVPRDGKPRLTGEFITDARLSFGQLNNKPEVSMSMNGEGASIWKKVTGENVGKSIAIVLDNYVYSYPNVNGEIAGGSSSISGNFTIKEAEDLSNILNSGKMDAPAHIVEEAVVGPSLGQEAINDGLISSVVGLLLVFLFMAFYYSTGGLVADLALIANVFFLMGVMTSLGAVLTLPGIAGIVLTIGMSVDANVLIYERIREELASGKGYKLAIADGYKNAYSAIIDSNVTTLLTGIILYIFGSGPIQGFATTLVIGILTSLFSAIFITRLVFEGFAARGKEMKFSIPMTANILKGSNFDFINQRRRFYLVSSLVIVAGIVSMFTKGFGFGVDFEGGRSYVVRFNEPVASDKAREALYAEFKQAPDVKVYGTSNQLQVTTDFMVEDESTAADSIVSSKMLTVLATLSADGQAPEILFSRKVEPTVANDIKESAVLSIIFSLVVLFLYLLIRFRRWQYGVGAIAALSYVVLFILSIFSIFNGILPFSLDIDQSFIAAILTVVGYAINDTVVIFDRIREYLGFQKSKNEELSVVINNALNSTLSRTVVTGLSTMGVLIILFIFGGEVIRGFSFAMLIGVIVGTYTSLFVASPVVVDLTRRVVASTAAKDAKDANQK
ncbi:MAG: protein translocase subunit SecDF [Bacteroidia bacterium]